MYSVLLTVAIGGSYKSLKLILLYIFFFRNKHSNEPKIHLSLPYFTHPSSRDRPYLEEPKKNIYLMTHELDISWVNKTVYSTENKEETK